MKNFKELILAETKELPNLPDEIWDLANLIRLDICHSNIMSLPASNV